MTAVGGHGLFQCNEKYPVFDHSRFRITVKTCSTVSGDCQRS